MRHGSATSLLHRQPGLGAVKRLNLALFVDAEHQRMLGWVHIEANHILKLLDKVSVVGQLEGFEQMRLQAVGMPDELHRRFADTTEFGHAVQLHCVACAGAVCVLAIISASLARAKGRKLRPRGRSSYSAATPPSAKRRRQSSTVGREVPSSLAIALLVLPSAPPRTIRARSATRCSVLPERPIRSTSSLLSGLAPNPHL